MKKIISTAIGALALFPVMASAADLPSRHRAPVEPAPAYVNPMPFFTWTGFYAGVNGGINIANFNGGAGKLWGGALGVLVGGTVGYNYQFNQLVLGVEGDWDVDTVRNSKTSPGVVFGFGKLTNVMTARLRAGVAVERALIFVTGGYVGGTESGSILDTSLAPGAQYFATSGWRSGYTLGAGIEYAFTDKVSGKAEYLYENMTTQNVFTPPRATTAGASNNVLRAGVNYHF